MTPVFKIPFQFKGLSRPLKIKGPSSVTRNVRSPIRFQVVALHPKLRGVHGMINPLEMADLGKTLNIFAASMEMFQILISDITLVVSGLNYLDNTQFRS